jgi:hypothetical protein
MGFIIALVLPLTFNVCQCIVGGGVKKFIRNKATEAFLDNTGAWTKNIKEARVFENTAEATKVGAQIKSDGGGKYTT